MKRQLLLLILIVIYSCNETNRPKTVIKKNIDSIKVDPFYGFDYDYLKHREATLKTIKLDTMKMPSEILRFYYDGSFENYPQFYEVNFSNRLLTQKLYTCVGLNPNDGSLSGVDSVISVKTFKLNTKDIETIIRLINQSMIWSLEQKDSEIRFVADGDNYTYEASRPKRTYEHFPEFVYKSYCYVTRHAPTNFDFMNLGEYLKLKADSKNHYEEK